MKRYGSVVIAWCLAFVAAATLWPMIASAAVKPLVPPTLRDELTNDEQASCPPKHDDKAVAPIPEDRKNPEGGSTDYFIVKWHWDDGNGNDLTFALWCVNGRDFSGELTQSQGTTSTVVSKAGEDTQGSTGHTGLL
jgi:hypothetical protein